MATKNHQGSEKFVPHYFQNGVIESNRNAIKSFLAKKYDLNTSVSELFPAISWAFDML